MNPKWVLSDDERLLKYGSRKKPKLNDTNSKSSSDKSQDQSPTSSSESLSSNYIYKRKPIVNHDIYRIEIDYLDQEDIELIDKLTMGFIYSTRSKKLIDSGNNVMTRVFKFGDTFAKIIPEIKRLEINDQMSLFLNSCFEMFVCSLVPVYFQMKTNEFQASSNDFLFNSMLKNENILKLFESFFTLSIDQTSVILLIPLVLFSPDRPHLSNRKLIYEIQATYSILLRKYLIHKLGKNENVYSRLLLKLVELRQYGESFGPEFA